MTVDLPDGWDRILKEETHKPYFQDLLRQLQEAYSATTCYPPAHQIFEALRLCTPADLKVVLIGQDPYHGPGQAHGLAFSVLEGRKHPPSLRNIFRELEEDTGKPYPDSGDLSSWARQGVLLLNTLLSVEEGKAGSHKGLGWEKFTDAVIREIGKQREGVIFLLWGAHARKKKALIDAGRHYILECGHPSPLSANRGHWFGNGHFSKVNEILVSSGRSPIQW